MSQQTPTTNGTNAHKSEKGYHKIASGQALQTAKAHEAKKELQLYGSCFCPFVQRVWISLEAKKMDYQYIEIDPYEKPKALTDINPRGLVPALRHDIEGEEPWGMYESTVLMEYLEDTHPTSPLLPTTPKEKAYTRLWTDHINRNVIPLFYKLLQAQDVTSQKKHASDLSTQIAKLIAAADATGPFFNGPTLSFADVQFAPWILRLRRVLGPYRGWPTPEAGSRWEKWVDAVEGHEAVRATTSNDELYLESYERYAENRPGTSQVADAVNEGRGLP